MRCHSTRPLSGHVALHYERRIRWTVDRRSGELTELVVGWGGRSGGRPATGAQRGMSVVITGASPNAHGVSAHHSV